MLEKIKIKNEPFFTYNEIIHEFVYTGELTGDYYVVAILEIPFRVVSCIDTNEMFVIKI